MQVETRIQKLKLSELADEINEAVRQCDEATVQTLASGMLTVQAAIRAGQSLSRVKTTVGHGKFLKWLSEFCKSISYPTAARWMQLAKLSRVRDLSDAKSITDAFRLVADVNAGRDKDQVTALGTASVDLYNELTSKLMKRAKSFTDITIEVETEFESMPNERKDEIRTALQPLVNCGAKLGVIANT